MNINQITKKTKKAELKGWIHDYRDLGGLKFLQLRDSTGIIQVTIIKDKADPSILKAVQRLTKESAISITGTVQENPKVKSGLEVIPTQLTVHATSKPELPISITEKQITTGLSKRLDWRCLDLRKLKHQAIFRIQSALLQGMRDHLLDQDYTQVFTPCLMGVASESGSDVFPVIYFNREAFLRQDPQLHRQLSIAGGIQKVFDIGPCWRAEQSHTSKHLTEHRVIAVESGFIKDELDTMRLEEGMIVAALTNVKKNAKKNSKPST